MLSFFTILLILVGANALFMVLSLTGASQGKKKSQNSTSNTTSKEYPFQASTSKFKKAV